MILHFLGRNSSYVMKQNIFPFIDLQWSKRTGNFLYWWIQYLHIRLWTNWFWENVYDGSKYCVWQNFRWLKFSSKAHTLFWDKNSPNLISRKLQASLEVVGGARVSCYMSMCMCTHNCANVSKFSLCKKLCKKIFPQWHALVKLAKISPCKISRYMVYTLNIKLI